MLSGDVSYRLKPPLREVYLVHTPTRSSRVWFSALLPDRVPVYHTVTRFLPPRIHFACFSHCGVREPPTSPPTTAVPLVPKSPREVEIDVTSVCRSWAWPVACSCGRPQDLSPDSMNENPQSTNRQRHADVPVCFGQIRATIVKRSRRERKSSTPANYDFDLRITRVSLHNGTALTSGAMGAGRLRETLTRAQRTRRGATM